MANPQVEDGYTKIANELVERLCLINLSAYEWRVLWAVWRKTYGWNKTLDKVSISQIEVLTGLDRRNVSRAKKSLLQKNMIVVNGLTIGFNKDFDTWQVSSIQTTKAIVYRDTRPRWFPPPGYPFRGSEYMLCGYCCKEVSRDTNINNHHILPKSKGGDDCRENMAFVCLDCHAKLHREINEYFCVNPDDRQGCYRHFVSRLSSIQTTFLSSYQTIQLSSIQTRTKESIKKIKETITKEIYGSFVELTEQEYKKLVTKFGEVKTTDIIDFFNLKIESKGLQEWRKDHKSDYATILMWERSGWIKFNGSSGNPIVSKSSEGILTWAQRERERMKGTGGQPNDNQ